MAMLPLAMLKEVAVEVIDLLKQAPIFSELNRRHLKRLAQTARVRSYKSGSVIIREGGEGFGLFIISSGKVEVVKGADGANPSVLATLGVGDFFGETALMERQPRNATVRALEDTECVAVWRVDFRSEVKRHPEIAVNMLSVLFRRLSDAAQPRS